MGGVLKAGPNTSGIRTQVLTNASPAVYCGAIPLWHLDTENGL